jgi:hypothetical protein
MNNAKLAGMFEGKDDAAYLRFLDQLRASVDLARDVAFDVQVCAGDAVMREKSDSARALLEECYERALHWFTDLPGSAKSESPIGSL